MSSSLRKDDDNDDTKPSNSSVQALVQLVLVVTDSEPHDKLYTETPVRDITLGHSEISNDLAIALATRNE